MKTGWLAPELPGVRPHPTPATYSLFSYEDLPPLPPEASDQEFAWLRRASVRTGSMAESGLSDGTKPDLAKLPRILRSVDAQPSASFSKFIDSVDLHRRMHSVTDCYFDVAGRIVRTANPNPGYLVHFLSDSQWCAHWYLHVGSLSQPVLSSANAYGFDLDEEAEPDASWLKDEIDLENEEIYLCASSFPEFIYRFWVENELWLALSKGRVSLPTVQREYVEHYRRITD